MPAEYGDIFAIAEIVISICAAQIYFPAFIYCQF